MSDEQKLEQLRRKIDDLDRQLLGALSERAGLAKIIAQTKGPSEDGSTFYRPEREAQILRKVIAENRGPLPNEEVARLFREIMSACLALEHTLNIAYLGPEGTFTQAAALKHFGHSTKTSAFSGIDQVFREVGAGACHYGVVPVENSIEGVVNHTLDILISSNLSICGEVELRIHHHLLSKTDELEKIKRVYSHQQPLAQCRRWLDANLSDAERIAVNSSAKAACMARNEPGTAAIAGDTAAELYSLAYLARNIEDEPDNTTRFLVIGSESVPESGRDKTSLLFSTPNKPGALHQMLTCFADNDVSMTRIESRPSRRGMWDYVFFVDIEGHAGNDKVKKALNDLEERASMLKLLGSYPRADI